MNPYKKVLVALALEENSDKKLLHKIHDFIAMGSEVYVLHVVENIPNYGTVYGMGAGIDIDEALMKEATTVLTKLLKPYHIPSHHQMVQIGVPKSIIVDEAKEKNVDLIVTGSHGRHGVSLLLGSTANGVLHSAPCDVLAVRLP